ncbi:MAG: hypothetical protein Ct9H300mP7_2870 [Verrucomicrobiota bacterium]|nr:MAG: hypothetical protein Ct9H300mP7_2870 [Verrucomicrobiota bacterium]
MEYPKRNWYYLLAMGDHIDEQHIHNLDVITGSRDSSGELPGNGGREVRTGIDHGEIFDHHAVEYKYGDGSYMFSQCRHIRGAGTGFEHVQGPRARGSVSGPHALADNDGKQKWRFPGGAKTIPAGTR